jgi:hypothetical protein
MADLALKLPLVPAGLVTTLSMLFLVAFGIKAAIFPLFFWLPASYHTPPVAVSALFGGMLTKVGVYALLRGFTLLFVADVALTHDPARLDRGHHDGHRRARGRRPDASSARSCRSTSSARSATWSWAWPSSRPSGSAAPSSTWSTTSSPRPTSS